MGLRIRSNMASVEAQRNLRVNTQGEQEEFAKMSSGKRINKSADDAAGMAIASSIKAQVKGLRQAARNANDGISLVQVAEGGLNETANILTRMRELTIQASSDTVGEQERGYLDQEYQQLLQEVDRIADTTVFSGASLINGESDRGVMEFHVGAFAGEHNRISFDSSATDAKASSLGVEGTNVSDKGDASDAIGNIDEAIQKVSSYRATLGSIQSRLQTTVTNLETSALNQDNARSQIEDLDYAQSTANLASMNIIKSAGIATLSQANNIPMNALKLLN